MHWDDKRTESWVGIMLRTGVLLAAALVLAGCILLILHPGHLRTDFRHFHGQPQQLTAVAGIFAAARRLDPQGLIMLGLLVLIATPVARVAMCIVGFSLVRDRMYVLVSALVLLILLYSLAFHR